MKTDTIPIEAQILMQLRRLSPTVQRELLALWKKDPTLMMRFVADVAQKHHGAHANVPGTLTAILEKERDEISSLLAEK